VRAAFFTVQETGQWIGSWTPWHGHMEVPAGAAYTLRPESHVVAEIHYRGADVPVVAEGLLGLRFDDQSDARAVSDLIVTATRRDGAASLPRLRGELRIAADTRIFALRPELTGDIRTLEVSTRRPDGGTDVLLFARDFDREWPTPFLLEEPMLLRRGTVLAVTAYAGSVDDRTSVRVTASSY
jgi:hypothetical protein